jgi:hypothetical protein
MLESEIIGRVVGGSTRARRSEPEQFDRAVVTCGSKVFVCRVERDALDMALVY